MLQHTQHHLDMRRRRSAPDATPTGGHELARHDFCGKLARVPAPVSPKARRHFFKLPPFRKLTTTDPFAGQGDTGELPALNMNVPRACCILLLLYYSRA